MDAGYYSSEINIIRDACSLNDMSLSSCVKNEALIIFI